MSRDVLLDQAAQLISDARVACLKLAISPEDIAKIMMDEAVLALMTSPLIDTKRELPRFYVNLKQHGQRVTVAMVAPLGPHSSASTRACFEFARPLG
jgi:hypothetical protein